MQIPKIGRTGRLFAVATAGVVVLLALVGLAVGANGTKPSTVANPVPTKTAVSPSESAAPGTPIVTVPVVPTSAPNFDSMKLTPEGWFPVLKTKDPRVLGAAVAVALWSYDTGATTRATTLDHVALFSNPFAGYVGSSERTEPLRSQLFETVAGQIMKSSSDFLGLQTDGIKVTAKVISVKSDSQLSDWSKSPPVIVTSEFQGHHAVTTTLEVSFTDPTSTNGQESDPSRVLVTTSVDCDRPDGYCGATILYPTPHL